MKGSGRRRSVESSWVPPWPEIVGNASFPRVSKQIRHLMMDGTESGLSFGLGANSGLSFEMHLVFDQRKHVDASPQDPGRGARAPLFPYGPCPCRATWGHITPHAE